VEAVRLESSADGLFAGVEKMVFNVLVFLVFKTKKPQKVEFFWFLTFYGF